MYILVIILTTLPLSRVMFSLDLFNLAEYDM
jgi:hypothetical protein